MRQVRNGVFETNSSSTHSITICPQETYDKWRDGKLLFNEWDDKFIEAKELTPDDYKHAGKQYESLKGKYYKNWNELSEEEQKAYTTEYVLKYRRNNDFNDDYITYDEWRDRNSGLEMYYKYYTTKNGDKIVAFGSYGYD